MQYGRLVLKCTREHPSPRVLESELKALSWVKEVVPVDTNIVVGILNEENKRDEIINKLAENGVKIMAFGPGMIRFVTHLDISSSEIDQTTQILKSI